MGRGKACTYSLVGGVARWEMGRGKACTYSLVGGVRGGRWGEGKPVHIVLWEGCEVGDGERESLYI